jgi:AcrR family transcriptional regulator
MHASETRRARAPRSDGARTRHAILQQAARLATVEGLEGLSISRLADAVGMSKSGLFAHFGSKEELQLATIETAAAIYAEQVMEPATGVEDGLERLRLLAEAFLHHVESQVYPGGCFFASVAAELDTQPGPARDMALGLIDEWMAALVGAARDAQAQGTVDADEEPEQLAFEVNSYLLLGNAQFVARPGPLPLARSRRAVERRLAEAAPARKRRARSR